MFNFEKLTHRYRSDSAFNQTVNLFRRLIEEHGLQPTELREAMFLAQYNYEMNRVDTIFKSDEEWERIGQARALMRQALDVNFPEMMASIHKEEEK